LPSSTLGVRYPDPFALGNHSYDGPGPREGNGIVYTCRGGHIDLTHARKATDWTACLAYRIREAILASRPDFTFKMREPSVFHVRIEYPANWNDLAASARDETAREVSIELGSYFAYTACTWHEILTWFGYKALGFYPEYKSAFSWEDNYSNALGAGLGAMALHDPDHEYNQAVTVALNRELARLGVQPKPAAWVAGKAVHGKWFTGNFLFYRMVKRHFDIGLDDSFVTPWLAPGVPGCDEPPPEDCPVPTLDFLKQHGFAVRFEIESREWEKTKILPIIYPNGPKGRIEPVRHFGPIMDYIRAQAAKRYGPAVGDPEVETANRRFESPCTTNPSSADVLDLSVLAARWLRDETS
jgi:hypothetical protein